MVGSLDGTQVVRGSISGRSRHGERHGLGRSLADDLLAQGARPILEAIRQCREQLLKD